MAEPLDEREPSNADDAPMPSAAEVAARRAAEMVQAALESETDGSLSPAGAEVVADADAAPAETAAADSYAPQQNASPPSEEELLELRRRAEQADKYLDRAQRAKAEFINYQKRMERERAQIREFARREIMLELLDVLDKFTLSMGKAADFQDFDSLLQAMKIVESELKAFMERVGLQRFEAEGQAFDPDLHAAMTQAPTADVPPGTVGDDAGADGGRPARNRHQTDPPGLPAGQSRLAAQPGGCGAGTRRGEWTERKSPAIHGRNVSRPAGMKDADVRISLQCLRPRIRNDPFDYGRRAAQMPRLRETKAGAVDQPRRRHHFQGLWILRDRLPVEGIQGKSQGRKESAESVFGKKLNQRRQVVREEIQEKGL